MPAGLRRAEHAQGCDEWISFYSCGGPLLLRLRGKRFSTFLFFFSICASGVHAHGFISLSVYPSSRVFATEAAFIVLVAGENLSACVYHKNEFLFFYYLLFLSGARRSPGEEFLSVILTFLCWIWRTRAGFFYSPQGCSPYSFRCGVGVDMFQEMIWSFPPSPAREVFSVRLLKRNYISSGQSQASRSVTMPNGEQVKHCGFTQTNTLPRDSTNQGHSVSHGTWGGQKHL